MKIASAAITSFPPRILKEVSVLVVHKQRQIFPLNSKEISAYSKYAKSLNQSDNFLCSSPELTGTSAPRCVVRREFPISTLNYG